MRVIKRFLFSLLFIQCFSASIYGQYYTTQVDINYTKNYDMTAMSDVKLTIWVDNNNLCLLFDRFPETEQGAMWTFSRKDYSSFNSNVDTESGYHAFSLVRRDRDFSYVTTVDFSKGIAKNGDILPFHFIRFRYFEASNGKLIYQDSKFSKYFVKLTKEQFIDIRQFIIEEADGCFYEYNPKWYDKWWEIDKHGF